METNKTNSMINYAIILVFTIVYLAPFYITQGFIQFSKVFLLLKYLAAVYGLLLVIFKKFKLNNLLWLIFLLHFQNLILAVFGLGNLTSSLNNTIGTFGMITVCGYAVKHYKYRYIRFVAIFGALMVALNALTASDQGLLQLSYGKADLFGIRTSALDFILPYFALTILYYNLNKNRGNKFFRILVPTSVFVFGSYYLFSREVSTGIVCMVVLPIYMVLGYKTAKKGMVALYLSTVVLNFSIVVLRLQNYFSWLIEDILHESLTLNNRTFIWDNVLFRIIQSPQTFLIGHGYKSGAVVFSDFGSMETHNQYLRFLYDGGIISCILYIILLCLILKYLKNYCDKYSPIVLGGVIILFGVAMLTECCCQTNLFTIFLVICATYEYVADLDTEVVKRKVKIKWK